MDASDRSAWALRDFEHHIRRIDRFRSTLRTKAAAYQLAKYAHTIAEEGIARAIAQNRSDLIFRFAESNKSNLLTMPSFKGKKTFAKRTGLRGIQNRLGKRKALIEYFWGDRYVYVLVIQHGGMSVHPLPIDPKLLACIERFRRSTQRPSSRLAYIPHAIELYRRLMKAAVRRLPSGIDELLIVPDGPLHGIAFESLLTTTPASGRRSASEEMPFLMRRFAIQYHYSANHWSYLKTRFDQSIRRSSAMDRWIGFAPTFPSARISGTRSAQAWTVDDLLCNSEELAQIRQFANGLAVVGPKANAHAFRASLSTRQWLHVSTHARLDTSSQENHGLYFSDRRLDLTEIERLPLDGKSIVLSVCHAGNGTFRRGEGILSLAKAFYQAGCTHSVHSLWALDDCASAELIPRYYQQLANGLASNRALQQAKLRFIARCHPIYRHPYYWASYVHYGCVRGREDERPPVAPVLLLSAVLGCSITTSCREQRRSASPVRLG